MVIPTTTERTHLTYIVMFHIDERAFLTLELPFYLKKLSYSHDYVAS